MTCCHIYGNPCKYCSAKVLQCLSEWIQKQCSHRTDADKTISSIFYDRCTLSIVLSVCSETLVPKTPTNWIFGNLKKTQMYIIYLVTLLFIQNNRIYNEQVTLMPWSPTKTALAEEMACLK